MDRPFKDKRPFGPLFSSSNNNFNYYEDKVGPLVVLRDFQEQIVDGEPKGSIMTDFGSLSWDGTHTLRVELSFHESQVSGDFKFKPMEHGGTRIQGTKISEFDGLAAQLGLMIEEVYDVTFEFSDLSASSHGHTHLTDYEFTYQTLIGTSTVKRTDIDEELNSVPTV